MKDEMDVLREVATTAAAYGSGALSDLLKRTVRLQLPVLNTSLDWDFSQEWNKDEIVLNVQSKLLSGIEGEILVVLEEKSAFRIVNRCCGEIRGEEKAFFTEMELSTIKEVGNIVIGSCVGALGVFLNVLVVSSIPTLVSGTVKDVFISMGLIDREKYTLTIEAIFEDADDQIKGRIYFFMNEKSKQIINQACKKILDSVRN